MGAMSNATTREEKPSRKRPTAFLRFTDREHHDLVLKCARQAGLSINGWICQATLRAARREAAEAARLDAMRQAEV